MGFFATYLDHRKVQFLDVIVTQLKVDQQPTHNNEVRVVVKMRIKMFCFSRWSCQYTAAGRTLPQALQDVELASYLN